MINSRKISDLHPVVARKCQDFIDKCEAAGIDVIITSTLRTMEEQAALYAQGRTKAGPIVTNAKPGQSWHNWGCAFDFVPIKNGKADWNNIMTFGKCGKIAESVGLEWGGRWRTMKDLPHCQFTGGNTLAQFQSGTADLSKLV